MKARAICKKNMWRVEVDFGDGTTLCLGKNIENIGFKFIEFNNKFEAENYIEKNKNLELDK
jgi:hypothetical protein